MNKIYNLLQKLRPKGRRAYKEIIKERVGMKQK